VRDSKDNVLQNTRRKFIRVAANPPRSGRPAVVLRPRVRPDALWDGSGYSGESDSKFKQRKPTDYSYTVAKASAPSTLAAQRSATQRNAAQLTAPAVPARLTRCGGGSQIVGVVSAPAYRFGITTKEGIMQRRETEVALLVVDGPKAPEREVCAPQRCWARTACALRCAGAADARLRLAHGDERDV
jgi:hypothetical protein